MQCATLSELASCVLRKTTLAFHSALHLTFTAPVKAYVSLAAVWTALVQCFYQPCMCWAPVSVGAVCFSLHLIATCIHTWCGRQCTLCVCMLSWLAAAHIYIYNPFHSGFWFASFHVPCNLKSCNVHDRGPICQKLQTSIFITKMSLSLFASDIYGPPVNLRQSRSRV